MNRFIQILIMLCLWVNVINAQFLTKDSKITIIGIAKYTESTIGQVVKIQFVEDPSKCDPIKGNMTIEQQIDFFSQNLSKQNVPLNTMKQVDDVYNTKFKQRVFEILTTNQDDIVKIRGLCTNLGVQVLETYYKMPEHRFEDEDLRAIDAVKDATKKAKAIALKLGNKKVKLLNIDDDTSEAQMSDLLDKYKDTEMYDQMIELYELLSQASSNPLKSSEPLRKGGYSIIATFSIQ